MNISWVPLNSCRFCCSLPGFSIGVFLGLTNVPNRLTTFCSISGYRLVRCSSKWNTSVMNFAHRLKVQSCQLRSCIVLTVVTEFFVAEFAYNRLCSNNNLPYGYVCVLQHPNAADILLLLCSVFFLHFVILVLRIFHKRDPNKVAVFLAAQKLLRSNDRLYTNNTLPYQPGAYDAVYLHCHSRLAL